MRHRQTSSGAGQLAALAGAAALMLALTFFAHGLLLGLSALVIGPLPAAKTALSLSRKQAAASSQPAASADAIEPDAPAQAQPDAAAPADTSYFVALEGDDARPADAGIILEKNYPQGSGEKYIPCGTGTIKNNTRVPAAEVAAEIEGPLPFSVEWNSPEPQILIMHTPPRTTACRRGSGSAPATAPGPPTAAIICAPWAGSWPTPSTLPG